MSIETLLNAPEMRCIDVPSYKVFDPLPPSGRRWKRIRQWNFSAEPVLLPWLGFNASGTPIAGKTVSLGGDSPTGQTMAKLAYNWGFDGLASYNIVPIEGGSSKKVIANIQKRADTDSVEWENTLSENLSAVSADLANVDALLIAWGDRRKVKFFTPLLSRLFSLLDNSHPPSTWAFDRNRRHDLEKTSPRHAYLSADAHSFDFLSCKPIPFPRRLFLKPKL